MPTDPARRLERAVVDLTTQVRRIADAMPTPLDDAPSSPAVVDTTPGVAVINGEATETCRPVEVNGDTIRVQGTGELSAEGRAALSALVHAAKAVADAQAASPDDYALAPPPDDDGPGSDYRDTLLHLLGRMSRGSLLDAERRLLREHVEHLLCSLDQATARIATLEHVAAGNKRHVRLIVPDLQRAEAALGRVRAFADRLDADADRLTAGTVHPVAAHIRAALDGPTGGE